MTKKKQEVTMVKPPKPLRDMTREEVDAFASKIYQRFTENNKPAASKKKK